MILPENRPFTNIVLIGMAGAGKSTIGPLLADRLQYGFVDTDELLAAAQGISLQELLAGCGQQRFQALEEQMLLALALEHHVIATGGSVVYSRPGMKHLRKTGLVIWLDVELAELEKRVTNPGSRGLVNPAGSSFADLYHQRLGLYQRYSNLQVACGRRDPRELVDEIVTWIKAL